MRTLLTIALTLLLSPYTAFGATITNSGGGSGSGVTIAMDTDLPATCTPGGSNALFLDTDDETFYFCSATNTFTQFNPAEADTLQTVFGRGNIINTAVSFATALKLLDENGDGYAWYVDPTDGPIFVCVDNFTEGACASYTRTLAAGQTLIYKNSGGSNIFVLTESTGAITSATLDCEATGNTCTITDIKWFDAAACQNSVAQLVWNVPASNAPAAACDPDSTPNAYASFDASTDESFDFDFVLPPGFTGAIDAHFIWKAAATSGAAGWCMQLVRVPDATTSGQSHAAQSSSNCVSDTAKGTTLQENRADKTGITCTSCAAGDRVKGRISRDANGGAVTDDMTGDAHLIKFGYTLRDAK